MERIEYDDISQKLTEIWKSINIIQKQRPYLMNKTEEINELKKLYEKLDALFTLGKP